MPICAVLGSSFWLKSTTQLCTSASMEGKGMKGKAEVNGAFSGKGKGEKGNGPDDVEGKGVKGDGKGNDDFEENAIVMQANAGKGKGEGVAGDNNNMEGEDDAPFCQSLLKGLGLPDTEVCLAQARWLPAEDIPKRMRLDAWWIPKTELANLMRNSAKRTNPDTGEQEFLIKYYMVPY
jgi:hypothetical protein